MSVNTDSSPFQSSPADSATSPRMFWHNRNMSTENSLYGDRFGSPSPLRRSSIERLQKASRVKNSNILALEQKQEYDPTRIPHIERPLAKVQGNAFGGRGALGLHSDAASASPTPERRRHSRSESQTESPLHDFTKTTQEEPSDNRPKTPNKDQSPIKSSMSTSRFQSSFDDATGTWTNEPRSEGKSLHRHTKSVTFDNGPPQVNEYEMATPDLSSVGTNSREGSYESDEYDDEYDPFYQNQNLDCQEDSFDASLEDTDKTPVVGPEDWRQDSPAHVEDPFYDSSPAPDGMPARASADYSSHQRADSFNSNGEHRPLPPLPGMTQSSGSYSRDSPSSPRSLPSPPSTSASPETQNIGNGKMSLEERLKLMMLSDDDNDAGKTAAEKQRERRMRRAGARDRFSSPLSETDNGSQAVTDAEEEDDTIGDLSGIEYQLPQRISRESIMRRVNNKTFERESTHLFSSPPPASGTERQIPPLDPDVPIPSTEEDSILEDDDDDAGSVIVRPELAEHEDDDYSLHDMSYNDDDSVIIHEDRDAQSESNYSDQPDSQELPPVPPNNEANPQDDTTPQAGTPDKEQSEAVTESQALEPSALPRPDNTDTEAPSMAEAHAYLQRPFTPERKHLSKPDYDGSGWGEPEEYEQEYEQEGTPESVIHNPVSDYEDDDVQSMEDVRLPSPDIPERVATIKASGSKLKTRLSATPSDMASMREARRQVSMEVPDVPPIPDRHRHRLSRDGEGGPPSGTSDYMQRHPSFKNRSLTLDLDMGLSLDKDFDRVIENQKVAFTQLVNTAHNTGNHPTRQASSTKSHHNNIVNPQSANVNSRQQRGYLMRQNTKFVAASDKESEDPWKTRSAGNSPVKADRPQSWTVEPWNPRARQRSFKKRPGSSSGPVPPLPGQESNATGLNTLAEEDYNAEIAPAESGERGRLFVKVMGVKDLDLPISKSEYRGPRVTGNATNTILAERTWFSLTLDNGVHCVTTAWLELARNAPIGQEFELVVPNDLEFQLTLNVKLEKPAPRPITPSPTKAPKTKTSTFSRVFASPKKRREMEMRQREEEQRLAQQRDMQTRRMNAPPSAYELLSPLVAEDGSFARSYVCLKEHESRCFGRPYIADVACFNEWATEEAGFASSVKSKRGSTAVVRRAPYKIGKLELQLLFVPRPKGATDDDMPKSMNSCIRELKAAEERQSRNWEGHLSQQGGDCPVSRPTFERDSTACLTPFAVLAPSLLQARGQQAHGVPRGDAAAAGDHQPRQHAASHRRPAGANGEGDDG